MLQPANPWRVLLKGILLFFAVELLFYAVHPDLSRLNIYNSPAMKRQRFPVDTHPPADAALKQESRPILARSLTFWWLLLVLVLFGIHTHQRLMEKTRLDFVITLQGQPVGATTTLDGKPAISGQIFPLAITPS